MSRRALTRGASAMDNIIGVILDLLGLTTETTEPNGAEALPFTPPGG